MAGWSTATGYSSQPHHHHQHLHGVTLSAADDPWVLSCRHYPYLYRDDSSTGRHLSRFPHYDIAAAPYEPAFVDCSTLFTNHHQQQPSTQDDVTQLQKSSSTPDLQKDLWTVSDYQSLVDHRRQHQLNYSS